MLAHFWFGFGRTANQFKPFISGTISFCIPFRIKPIVTNNPVHRWRSAGINSCVTWPGVGGHIIKMGILARKTTLQKSVKASRAIMTLIPVQKIVPHLIHHNANHNFGFRVRGFLGIGHKRQKGKYNQQRKQKSHNVLEKMALILRMDGFNCAKVGKSQPAADESFVKKEDSTIPSRSNQTSGRILLFKPLENAIKK
jgi:hypothetical protein